MGYIFEKSIDIAELMKRHYHPHWEAIVMERNHVSLILYPFDSALGETYPMVSVGSFVDIKRSFESVQMILSRHMTEIVKREEYNQTLVQIRGIMSEYLHRPNTPEVRNALTQAVNAYWEQNIPYDIQMMDADQARVMLNIANLDNIGDVLL